MTEVEGTHKVSRLASTRTRLVLAVVALLIFVSAEIAVVLHRISAIDANNLNHGVSSAKTTFIVGTVLLLVCVVAMSLWSQIEIKKRLSEISKAAGSIADGDLDPDVRLLVHDFDEVGRSAGAVQRMLGELRTIADHAGRVAEGDLSGELIAALRARRAAPLAGQDDRRPARHGRRPLAGRRDRRRRCRAASQIDADEAGRAVDEIARAVGEVASGAERQVASVIEVRGLSTSVATATQDSAAGAAAAADQAARARELAHEGAAAVGAASEAMIAVSGA